MGKRLNVTVYLKKMEGEIGEPSLVMTNCRPPQVIGPLYIVQHFPNGGRELLETAVTLHSIRYIDTREIEIKDPRDEAGNA